MTDPATTQPTPGTAALAGSGRKIRDFPVVVDDVVWETHDTVSLYLANAEPDHGEWTYKPGQFVSIHPNQFPGLKSFIGYLEHTKGKRELPRAYSLGSAPHEKHLIVTVKEEFWEEGETDYPPLLSGHLCHNVRKGDQMIVKGIAGPYVFSDDIDERVDHVVHICSGSGIVPNWGLVKHALHTGMKLRHTLLFSNRTHADIIYKKQWDELAAAHADKLKVVYHLTRETDESLITGNVVKGRISLDHLREVIADPNAVEVYACGSALTKWDKKRAEATGVEPRPKFMETLKANIAELGVPKKQFHKEEW